MINRLMQGGALPGVYWRNLPFSCKWTPDLRIARVHTCISNFFFPNIDINCMGRQDGSWNVNYGGVELLLVLKSGIHPVWVKTSLHFICRLSNDPACLACCLRLLYDAQLSLNQTKWHRRQLAILYQFNSSQQPWKYYRYHTVVGIHWRQSAS